MQLKADILGKPVEIIAEPEAVSQGAAILAGRYCGCITDWNPGISAVYLPGERSHFLRSRYLRYQERVAETLCSDAAGRCPSVLCLYFSALSIFSAFPLIL